MHFEKFRLMSIATSIALLLLVLGSFNQSVFAAESSPEKPGDTIGTKSRTIYDQTDEKTAADKVAFGGDVFGLGWYERPFDQNMGYMPFIDMQKVLLNREDANWVYVQIFVMGDVKQGSSVNPLYGVEWDTDLDNRGEFLLLSAIPGGTDWSTQGVVVYSNSDNMLGGTKPVLVDKTAASNAGYDTEVFNSGKGNDPNLAWSRLSPSNPNVVELALKSSFLGGPKGKFIWFPWTMVSAQDLKKFEFNDKFSLSDAGSPVKKEAHLINFNGFTALTTSGDEYPLKGLWGIDNTPRYASGFTPNGLMPGLGSSYEPTPEPIPHAPAYVPPPPM
jgi:hypothetical protein